MFSVPDTVPVAVGEKLTLIVHVPDGANELPQVVLSMPNTALLVPMLLIVTVAPAAVLGLVNVVVLSALVVPLGTTPNERDSGESVNTESVPVPLSGIIAGLFLALLAMTRSPPKLAPGTVGIKSTPTVQEVPGANEAPP